MLAGRPWAASYRDSFRSTEPEPVDGTQIRPAQRHGRRSRPLRAPGTRWRWSSTNCSTTTLPIRAASCFGPRRAKIDRWPARRRRADDCRRRGSGDTGLGGGPHRARSPQISPPRHWRELSPPAHRPRANREDARGVRRAWETEAFELLGHSPMETTMTLE